MKQHGHESIAEKKALIERHLKNCNLCPRRCGVDRLAGEVGFCGVDWRGRCFEEMVVTYEEAGLNPSHQIYWAGCNLRCEFCTVGQWNEQPEAAGVTNTAALAETIERRHRDDGTVTVNLLGGEPAVSLLAILELLSLLDWRSRVVWNSNMYYSEIVGKTLSGLVDIYLADFKCGNGRCSERLLDAADYADVVKLRLGEIGDDVDVIVRHVVMPGHVHCCLEPLLKWLAECADDVRLSLRNNYVPPIPAGKAPSGHLGRDEWDEAVRLAQASGLRLIV